MKNRFIKKICTASLSVLMVIGAGTAEINSFIGTSLPVYATETKTPASSFDYEVNEEGGITITRFKGNESVVVVPESINGKNVTSIGTSAFYCCTELTGITIPNSVKSIGNYAFSYCASLTSITIPNSVTSIGNHAFSGCTSLTSITIPNSVTSIEDGAFYHCTRLTSIDVDTYNRSYCSVDGRLYSKDKTVLLCYPAGKSGKYTIPDSVTSIGDYAFSDCTSLTSITIPNSVTSIGNYAFFGCTSLTSITIPNTVTSVGDYAFSDCTSLTNITIPNSVTGIGNHAFSGCTSLTSITIPNSVTSIGTSAFSYCTELTGITIPNSVTSIGKYAFSSCRGLTSITIPDSVTSIDYWAFASCTGLTSITIPSRVTNIDNNAFNYCTGLKEFKVSERNSSFSSLDGVLYNKERTTLLRYPYAKSSSYSIPDSVTNIGNYAFSYCTELTGITIPNSVVSIGYNAFEHCTGLKSISIPNSVTSIGYCAFYYCIGLKSITIPDSLTSIEGNVFCNCNSLKTVVIPNSVTNIGYHAFYDCTSLTNLTIPANITVSNYAFTNTNLTELTILGNGKSLGFVGDVISTLCKKVTLKKGVEELNGSFCGIYNLTEVILPNSLKKIGANSFRNCSNLKIVTIPSSVKEIDETAFDDGICLTIIGSPDSVAEQFANEHNIDFLPIKKLANTSKLSSDTIVIGNRVTVNAFSSGGVGTKKYALWYKKSSSSTWTKARDYAESSTITFTPKHTGKYDVTVKVKDIYDTVVKKSFIVTVNKVLENTSTISANTIMEGKNVTVNASSTGGVGTKKYAVWYKRTSSSTWAKARDYAEGTTISFKPKYVDEYEICVKVKDEKGTVKKKLLSVNVITSTFFNTSTFSNSYGSKGWCVTVNASSTGGVGTKKYAVWYKPSDSSTWTKARGYDEGTTISFFPKYWDAYDICVKVKDEEGTIKKKLLIAYPDDGH